MYSWYRNGLLVETRTHGIDLESWYRHGRIVLSTPIVLTQSLSLSQTHGIEAVLPNHTSTRGPRVTRMRDFLFFKLLFLPAILAPSSFQKPKHLWGSTLKKSVIGIFLKKNYWGSWSCLWVHSACTVSRVICHMSCVTCHLFCFIKNLRQSFEAIPCSL